jgi:hypothetical protein
MRTTITLNDNLALGLRKLQEKFPDKTFKDIVNETIAKGLAVSEVVEKQEFKLKTRNAVPKKGIDFDNIGKLIEFAEGDWHK